MVIRIQFRPKVAEMAIRSAVSLLAEAAFLLSQLLSKYYLVNLLSVSVVALNVLIMHMSLLCTVNETHHFLYTAY
jgi:hypothetical protein